MEEFEKLGWPHRLIVHPSEHAHLVAGGVDPALLQLVQKIPVPPFPPLPDENAVGAPMRADKLTVDMIEKAKALAKSCKPRVPTLYDEDGKEFYVWPVTERQRRHFRYNFGSTAVRLIMDIEDRINGRN